LRQNKRNDIPLDCIPAYRALLNSLIGHYKKIIDQIIVEGGGKLSFPMETTLLENYLEGFSFEYHPLPIWLESEQKDIEGFSEYSLVNPDKVVIYYNASAPSCRQRFTKIHELFHFIQSLDVKFLNFFDELILNSTLPPDVVNKIMERGTDKAVAMYLMPNNYFLKKYDEIRKEIGVRKMKYAVLQELARYFDVSKQTARFRLGECGILVPS